MFRKACGRLLWVAVGVSAPLAFSNALAQAPAAMIQQLQSEAAGLRAKLDKLDMNSESILTLQDEKVHLSYAPDMNQGAESGYPAGKAKEIDQEIDKLRRENGLLRKQVNTGLAYIVSLATSSTMMAQELENSVVSPDKRAIGTCPESIARPAAPGRIVAPFSPPRGAPTPPTARIQSGAGNGAADAR
jgi:hypothetical protein